MYHIAIVSLGSNLDCGEKVVMSVSDKLKSMFQDVKHSIVKRTKAVDMPDDTVDYYNMVLSLQTEYSLSSLQSIMKKLEIECGDDDVLRDRGVIVIDIDVVEFDDTIVKANDVKREYYKELKAYLDSIE